jgi:ATP-binding protein involved in chromosome partitioning
MSQTLRQQVETALQEYQDPLLGTSLGAARVLREIELDAQGRVHAKIVLGFPARSHGPVLAEALRTRLQGIAGVRGAQIEVGARIVPHQALQGVKRLAAVRNIIAVASGKGGVGKSTVAANLALALAAEGARVGMLDADIYGPSQPRMLGVRGRPDSVDGKRFKPMRSHTVQSMSVGYLIDEDTPMVWRGPMVTQALQQLLNDTDWQDLDYLIVDMPPGTGDIQLTLSQHVPVSGAVIVTTPQDIATLDARKGLQMFRKVNVPVMGIIENMALHICSGCGQEDAIFGSGGGERIASDDHVPLLGRLPLDRRIREDADGGTPTVLADPDGPIAARFREIALRMAAKLSLQAEDFSGKFPQIVVVND